MSHHHFLLADHGVDGPSPRTLAAAWTNGLVACEPGVAVVLTGIHTGPVDVEVDLHDHAPPLYTEPWDNVVEVSLTAPRGAVVAGGIMSRGTEGLPVLTHAGPGTYRLRVHVTGRDRAVDLSPVEPVESYRLTLWPAPPAGDVVHKSTDEYGTDLRTRAPKL
uniref:hypothetical protein n=1 Tax=Saccharothrix espanaensis TaxID=103731 RepID=UPI003F497335